MFWENFSRLCAENNIKPNPLAKKLGIPSATITNWKNGRIPHHTTLIKIADYFDVSVDYLLGNQQQPSAPGMDVPGDSPALLKSMEILKNLSEEEQELALSLIETVANRKNKPKS